MLDGLISAGIMSAALMQADEERFDCAAAFTAVADAIEARYVAIALISRHDAAYPDDVARRRADALARAEAADGEYFDCFFAVSDYVDSFGDPHLALHDGREFETQSRRRTDEDQARLFLDRAREASGRGLAGVWRADAGRIAVAPVDDVEDGYIAVMAEPGPESEFQRGDVLFEAHPAQSGYRPYHGVIYSSDLTASVARIGLIKNDVLAAANERWVREGAADSAAPDWIDVQSPDSPVFAQLDSRSVLITLPVFSGEAAEEIAPLIENHAEDIAAAELLIVDLRGHSGGSPGYADPLEPFIYAEPQEPVHDEFDPVALSSGLSRAWYNYLASNTSDETWSGRFTGIVERLEAADGEVIQLYPDPAVRAETRESTVPEEISETPRHVAILVDRETISAGEAFLLHSMRSPRVTVFGENTAGAIDYQTSVTTGVPGVAGFNLAAPVFAHSADTPAKGFPEGIPPDVRLDMSRDADPVAAILEHYGLE